MHEKTSVNIETYFPIFRHPEHFVMYINMGDTVYTCSGIKEFDISIENDSNDNYHIENKNWRHNDPGTPRKRVKLYLRGMYFTRYTSTYALTYSIRGNYPLHCQVRVQDYVSVEGLFVCSKLRYSSSGTGNLEFTAHMVSHGRIHILHPPR